MKKLKFINIAILLFLTTNITFAKTQIEVTFDNNYQRPDYNHPAYKKQINYFNNMKTCTKGTFPLGTYSIGIESKTIDISSTYYIYGIQNNKCHIRQLIADDDVQCYLPMDVAKKYAEEGINTLNAAMKNGAAYSEYNNQIRNDENYCKIIHYQK